MSLRRLGVLQPAAGVAAELSEVSYTHFASVIATNLTNLTAGLTAYIIPEGATTESEYVYLLYNFPLEPGNSVESHRFAMNARDQVWVKSDIDGVSFFCEGIPQTGVSLVYSSGPTEEIPLSPIVGDLYFDTTLQKLFIYKATGWQALAYEV